MLSKVFGVHPGEVQTGDVELRRVIRLRQLRGYRLGSLLRIGVLGLMVGAMLVGAAPDEWPRQIVLLVVYAIAALCALIRSFSPSRRASDAMGRLEPFAFIVIDVLVLTGFQFLSRSSGDHSILLLLVMMLLPALVGLDVSWRRAAVVLGATIVGMAGAMIADPETLPQLGWAASIYVLVLYGFWCCAALLASRRGEEYTRSVARLSVSREELLAQTMTASEDLQRRISESIHDGPLQNVLAVRQELVELAMEAPGDERLDRALAGLKDASERLRQATFELHPAVLQQVGLGAAVEQLAAFTAKRSAIAITTDIDYPVRDPIDPIVFGVVRELVSNVVRHSKASRASITLGITDHTCQVDVADNGIGITNEAMARRLALGHIGLASHRARVDAAGGAFQFLDAPKGTHVRVELPLAG